mgnify:CR=1 FL=1
MQKIDQRRLIGKIVPEDIHDRLLKRHCLDDGAVARLSHDDIDGGEQGLKGEGEYLCGMNSGKFYGNRAIDEEAILAQLFHLCKREGAERNTAESNQDGPFVGCQVEGSGESVSFRGGGAGYRANITDGGEYIDLGGRSDTKGLVGFAIETTDGLNQPLT